MGQSVMPSEQQLDYLSRTGDPYIDKRNYTENKHGFASYEICDNHILVIQVYGDGKYWDKFFRDLAKEHGLQSYIFSTRRNPAAFSRRFNASVIETWMRVKV